jgi:hypothetical protein
MDLLTIILGLSYVFRRLRRRERGEAQPNAPRAALALPSTATTLAGSVVHLRRALLIQAARGLLLAGLVLAFALIPWPTAWTTSVTLLPHVQPWRRAIVHHVDVITVSLVVVATIEPLLVQLLSLIQHTPRLLGLLVQLVWVLLRLSYWRYRNWRRCTIAI